MTIITKPYINTELRTEVNLEPNQMNNDIYINLKMNLKNKVEGKCNEYGYVDKVHKILEYDYGMIDIENFDCLAKYNVKYSARIYIPIEDTIIISKIEKIHKPLILSKNGPILSAIKLSNIDDSKFKILNGEIIHIVSDQKLQVGSYIKMIIRAKKINYRSPKIDTLGYIMDLASPDEIKDYYLDESIDINENPENVIDI